MYLFIFLSLVPIHYGLAQPNVYTLTDTLNTFRRAASETMTSAAERFPGEGVRLGRAVSSPTSFPSISDNIPLLSAAIGLHSSITAAIDESDDICYDEEGIKSLAPVITKLTGRLGTYAAAGVAGTGCAGIATPLTPVGMTAAGIACSFGTAAAGGKIVDLVTDKAHGRRRAVRHKHEVRMILKEIMQIGKIDDDSLHEWRAQAMNAAASMRLYDVKEAKRFWTVLSDNNPEFINNMLELADSYGVRQQAEAHIEYATKHEGYNMFMPSSVQVDNLKSRILSNWCLPSNWYEWIELWQDDILYTGFDRAIRRDQKNRAKAIVSKLTSLGLKGKEVTITMMDGHGRQWLAILIELREQGFDLNMIRLRIVDIVDSVNDWHDLFFPKGMTTVVRSTIEQGGIFLEEAPKNGVLYMNFCGLKGTNKILEDRITALKEAGTLSRTFVSISSRGGGNPETYDHLKKIGNLVSNRGAKGIGFHTFSFD